MHCHVKKGAEVRPTWRLRVMRASCSASCGPLELRTKTLGELLIGTRRRVTSSLTVCNHQTKLLTSFQVFFFFF
jgi:hypothetical protein